MTVIINIEIKNQEQIRAAFKKAPATMITNLNTAVKKVILFIRARAVQEAPVKTGNLRASARTTFAPLKGELEFKAKYAAWVHEGTSPYQIRPTSKKALFWKGAAHPVRVVNHPGIRANPFLRRAVENSQTQTDAMFEEAVQNTLNTVAKEIG